MQEKLFFQSSNCSKLVGILSNPTGDKGKLVMVFCHGFATTKESQTYLILEKELNKKGIATFRFDFFGHGESEGKFEDIIISEAVDDAMQAISFMKEKGFSKIGLFGSSFGGMAALLATSKTPGLQLLALKSPVSDYLGKISAKESNVTIEEWKKKGFVWYESSRMGRQKLNYSFFEDAKKASGFEVASKITIPTIIVHGGKDTVVPVEQSRKTALLIPNCKLEVIEGADHKYSKPDEFEKMIKLILEFVAENA